MLAVLKKIGDFAQRLKLKTAGMAETPGSAGGYLVPEEMQIAVMESLGETSVFHRLAYQQPMKSRTCDIPAFDLAATHATGASPLWGGMAVSWIDNLGSALAPESEPKFAQAQLVARELACVCYATNQLVDDGGEALGAYLFRQFTKALRWTVERACYQGNGTTQPAGIIISPATVPITRVLASHVSQADVANMVAALLPGCFEDCVWSVHPTTLGDIITLPTYSNVVGEHSRLCGTFYGRPMFATENLPPLGTAGDVVLWSPQMYALGTRQFEVAWAREDPIAFRSNLTAYRLIWRGDGQTIPRGKSTLADGVTTSGAFVALQ